MARSGRRLVVQHIFVRHNFFGVFCLFFLDVVIPARTEYAVQSLSAGGISVYTKIKAEGLSPFRPDC